MSKNVDVDPRVRMKEIRAYVKNYIGGSNPDGLAHLGEYPKNMDDAVRMIIALQDQLENTMGRHKKASDHVHNLMQMSELTCTMLMDSMFQGFETSERLCAQRDAALELHEKECMAHMETRHQLAEMNSHASELQQRWQTTLTQLDAAMMTLKTSLNGG